MAYDLVAKNEHWDEITRKLKDSVEIFIGEAKSELASIRNTIQNNGFDGCELADGVKNSLNESAELIEAEIKKMEAMLPTIQSKIDGYTRTLEKFRVV